MKNKFFFIIVVVLIISAGLVYSLISMDNYKYITEDNFGKWYYDKTSIEYRIDEETGAEIIDVWLKRDLNENNLSKCAKDEILWHIDTENRRYKGTDTIATDKDGNILET